MCVDNPRVILRRLIPTLVTATDAIRSILGLGLAWLDRTGYAYIVVVEL